MFSRTYLGCKLLGNSPLIPKSISWNFANSVLFHSSPANFDKNKPPKTNKHKPRNDPDDCCNCERKKPKKETILHKIKLKVIEGGTNFGTPFNWLKKQPAPCPVKVEDEDVVKELEAKSEPEPESKPMIALPAPPSPPGVQVTIIGADTCLGQYVSLLLKQCPAIKRLRLYETKETPTDPCNPCQRDICSIACDLQCINTSCDVQGYSCCYNELGRALQSFKASAKRYGRWKVSGSIDNLFSMISYTTYVKISQENLCENTDIVLILESGGLRMDMPLNQRFGYQAPIIKRYADAIACETPLSFIICCASPVECMVPLIAETLKETGWYDPRKLFGSVAVPEMRASTLAAQALCLEPWYTRVPCVGGAEGNSLVPLFSNAVEYFDFDEKNAIKLTCSIRNMPAQLAQSPESNVITCTASEAYAIARLVTKVAHALINNDVPIVTGFVEADCSQVISPAKYIASPLLINCNGICRQLGLPKMNELEKNLLDLASIQIAQNLAMSKAWYDKYLMSTERFDTQQTEFFKSFNRTFDDCAYSNM